VHNSFIYHYGDNTSSTNPNVITNHLYDNITSSSVNYTCWLIAQNNFGCKDSTQLSIQVYPRVVAQFTSDSAGCSPLYIQFNNHSLNASTYLWNFGDGSTSTTYEPNHLFINNTTGTQTYPVHLTATSSYGCNATFTKNITVYAVPVATFVVDSTVLHYPNQTIIIDNTTSGTWQYLWNFGDGTSSTLMEPHQHTYANYGNYQVSLIAYSPFCSDTTA
jgi:PKD repeat protein